MTDSPISGIAISSAAALQLGWVLAVAVAARSSVRLVARGRRVASPPAPLATRRGLLAAPRLAGASPFPAAAVRVDLGQRLADLDRLVGLHQELGDGAAGGRRDLGVDLVGGDLDHGLALLDRIPLRDVPLEHGALGHRLAHLGHQDLNRLLSRHSPY